MSAIDQLARQERMLKMMDQAGVVNEKLMAIAKEKVPDADPQSVLEGVMAKAMEGVPLQDMDYKTKLDLMAVDLGPEHFAPVRSNPDFQNIFNTWMMDYGQRQFRKMTEKVSAWTDGKVTQEEVNLLINASQMAFQMVE